MKKLFFFISFVFLGKTIFAQQAASQNKINVKDLTLIGKVDERFQSYNIEMCEVIGGDFWIPYNLVDSVRKHSNRKGIDALKWKIEPINLYEKKIRNLAAGLGPTYVRVSGTWANAIYFQNNDDAKLTTVPKGFKNILTRKQWKGVVDFCKAVNGKIVTSFPISDGMRDASGQWEPTQVKSIIDYTNAIGGEIHAAEFFNEPSHAIHGDAPKGYNGQTFAKEFALFKNFVSTYAPKMKVIGPGSSTEGGIIPAGLDFPIDELLSPSPKPTFEVFTYHYYGNISKRCLGGQKAENALSADWLKRTEKGLEFYQNARDKYMPNTPIWLTETAETACGGNPWAATFIDTFRYLDQMGRLAKKGVQVVMHNTLARSEYGLLDHDTHNPRPNYWAALLWNKLMGNQVYDAGSLEDGLYIYAHNQKNQPKGKTILVINTNKTASTLTIPTDANQYLLTAEELVTKKVSLNGKELKLLENDELPAIKGVKVKKGTIEIPAYGIMFLTFNK